MAVFNSTFWTKYFFRVCHITSLVVICQAVINAKMSGALSQDYKTLYMIAGIIVVVSGLVNTFILKPKEMGDQKKKLWIGFNHLKALTALILFTPLVKIFPISLETRIDIQFYWMVLALLLSPFARFYREFFVAKENEAKQKKLKSES